MSVTTWSDLRRALKSEYQNDAQLQRLFAAESEKPWMIKDISVNLASVITTNEQDSSSWNDMYVTSSESLYGNREPTSLAQVFSKKASDASQRIWMMGAAGCGKSTITQRIAFDWASENEITPFNLPCPEKPFELVIRVNLRHLSRVMIDLKVNGDLIKNKRTKKLVFDECFGLFLIRIFPNISEEIYPEDISVVLKEYQSKILLVLDGYDEIAGTGQNNPDGGLVLEMFQSYLCKFPNLIVTTRPYYNVPKDGNFVKVELLGFVLEDCHEYIDRHFSEYSDELSKSGREKLIELLDNNPKLLGIVHIPVNLEILCRLFTGNGTSSLPKLDFASVTQTKLYYTKLKYLLLRSMTRDGANVLESEAVAWSEFETNGTLNVLGSLALRGIVARRMVFSHEELKEILTEEGKGDISFVQSLLQKGFLRGFIWTDNGKNFVGDGEFIHLTFQEFFAALYLVHNAKSNTKVRINSNDPNLLCDHLDLLVDVQYKFSATFAMTWPFVAGMFRNLHLDSHLNQFAEVLANQSPFDLSGKYIFPLILRCAEETLPGTLVPAWQNQLAPLMSAPEEKSNLFASELTTCVNVTRYFGKDMDLLRIKRGLFIDHTALTTSYGDETLDIDPYSDKLNSLSDSDDSDSDSDSDDSDSDIDTDSDSDYEDDENKDFFEIEINKKRTTRAREEYFREREMCQDILDQIRFLSQNSRKNYLVSVVEECFLQELNPDSESLIILGLIRMKLLPLKYFTENLLKKLFSFVKSSNQKISSQARARVIRFRYEFQDFKHGLVQTLEKMLASSPEEAGCALRVLRLLIFENSLRINSTMIIDNYIKILRNPLFQSSWRDLFITIQVFPRSLTVRADLASTLIGLVVSTSLEKERFLAIQTLVELKMHRVLSVEDLRQVIPVLFDSNPVMVFNAIALFSKLGKQHQEIFAELFDLLMKKLTSEEFQDIDDWSIGEMQEEIPFAFGYLNILARTSIGVITEQDLIQQLERLFQADLPQEEKIVWKKLILHHYFHGKLSEEFRESILNKFLNFISSYPQTGLSWILAWELPLTNPRVMSEIGIHLASDNPQIFMSAVRVTPNDYISPYLNFSVEVYEALSGIIGPFLECLIRTEKLSQANLNDILKKIFITFENLTIAEIGSADDAQKIAIQKTKEAFKKPAQNPIIAQELKNAMWPKNREITEINPVSSIRLLAHCGLIDYNYVEEQCAKYLKESEINLSVATQMLNICQLLAPEKLSDTLWSLFYSPSIYSKSTLLTHLASLLTSLQNIAWIPLAIITKKSSEDYFMSLLGHNGIDTFTLPISRNRVRELLAYYNTSRNLTFIPEQPDFTREFEVKLENLETPPFQSSTAFVQYFIDHLDEQPRLRDLALNYLCGVSRTDELVSLNCWFECGDVEINNALANQFHFNMGTENQQAQFAGEYQESQQIQLLEQILERIKNEEHFSGTVNSTECVANLVNANQLLDKLFANGVVLNSELRMKLQKLNSQLLTNLESRAGTLPYLYFLLLRLNQGLNALASIETRSNKVQRKKLSRQQLVQLAKKSSQTLSKISGRLESGLGLALINAIGVEGVALGPLLFAFGSSIYSATSLGIESLEPAKNLFDSQSHINFTPLGSVSTLSRADQLEFGEEQWSSCFQILQETVEELSTLQHKLMSSNSKTNLVMDLMGIVVFLSEIQLRDGRNKVSREVYAIFKSIFSEFESLGCVRALVVHHTLLLHHFGHKSFPADKQQLLDSYLFKPPSYDKFVLFKQEKLDKIKKKEFQRRFKTFDHFDSYKRSRDSAGNLIDEFMSQGIVLKEFEKDSPVGFSGFAKLWFEVFRNDQTIYQANVLFFQFLLTESQSQAQSAFKLLQIASVELLLSSTSEWGRSVYQCLFSVLAKFSASK